MRGNAEMHELVAPGSLGAVLDLLAAEPGQWTPIAGGTELMVAFSAGRLNAHKLVNLWGIPDLRTIEATPQSVAVGAAATFLDLRKHAGLNAEFPLLARAASWIGSVANQSRATLRILRPRCWRTTLRLRLSPCAAGEKFPTPSFTPATSAMCSPWMSCSTQFTCRGDSRATGNICAKWERGVPWQLPK
jgi:hypothetical protein